MRRPRDTIILFAREPGGRGKQGEAMPTLVYIQGALALSHRVQRVEGWIGRALDTYRVLLVDQRGTGRSTPVPRRASRLDSARSSGLPEPLPSGRHRPGPRAHQRRPPWARGDLDHPRPELRWLLRPELPRLQGTSPFTGVAPAHRGERRPSLRGDLQAGAHPQCALLQALPRRPAAPQRARRAPEHPRDHAPDYHAACLATARHAPRRSRWRRDANYLLEEPFLEGPKGADQLPLLATGRERAALRHQPHLCAAPRGHLLPWRSLEVVSPPVGQQLNIIDTLPFRFTGEMVYPWMFEDYVELRPLKEAAEPSLRGRLAASTTERAWPKTRSPAPPPSTTMTCMSSAPSRSRAPRSLAICAPGHEDLSQWAPRGRSQDLVAPPRPHRGRPLS